MALAIDSTSDTGSGAWIAGAGPVTWTHTTGAGLSSSVGVVLISYLGVVSGVTWDGVAMTQSIAYTSPAGFYAYIILNPSAGAKNISVSYSDSQPYHFCAAYVLSGANQSTTADSTGTNTAASGSTFSISLTTVANNCQILGIFYQNSGSSTTAGSATTITAGSTATAYYGKSTSLVSAGANALNLATAGSPSQWVGIAVAIAPVPVAAKGNFLAFM